MSQQEKARYYQALKTSGVEFTRHYREYTEQELKEAYDKLAAQGQAAPIEQDGPPYPPPGVETPAPDPAAAAFFGFDAPSPAPNPVPTTAAPPVMHRDPNEIAGQRLNTKTDDEPIRTDPVTGYIWYREEVLKPAYPKPRARRVLKYQDAGVQVKTVTNGDYLESFEVSGDPANAREAEVKITMPSYQTGLYRDPRFPFKTVCYNGNEGFDRDDIINYWGGAELVPEEVKRKYVENVLCYDISTVIRAIEHEFRRLQLQNRI